jgi:hypothetical protein
LRVGQVLDVGDGKVHGIFRLVQEHLPLPKQQVCAQSSVLVLGLMANGTRLLQHRYSQLLNQTSGLTTRFERPTYTRYQGHGAGLGCRNSRS